MIRSSTGRKEISIEHLKKDIEEGKEILVRFLYEKEFRKIEGYEKEITSYGGRKHILLLCDDGIYRRSYDIMEIKII